MIYKIKIRVKEIRGYCPIYRVDDEIIIIGCHIVKIPDNGICLHSIISMATFIYALTHGVSAKELGIGKEENVGFIQCQDPGPPLTEGGTVFFELRREKHG